MTIQTGTPVQFFPQGMSGFPEASPGEALAAAVTHVDQFVQGQANLSVFRDKTGVGEVKYVQNVQRWTQAHEDAGNVAFFKEIASLSMDVTSDVVVGLNGFDTFLMRNTAAATVDATQNNDIAAGTEVTVVRLGAGAVEILAGSGVTVHNSGGLHVVAGGVARLRCLVDGGTEWLAWGDLS